MYGPNKSRRKLYGGVTENIENNDIAEIQSIETILSIRSTKIGAKIELDSNFNTNNDYDISNTITKSSNINRPSYGSKNTKIIITNHSTTSKVKYQSKSVKYHSKSSKRRPKSSKSSKKPNTYYSKGRPSSKRKKRRSNKNRCQYNSKYCNSDIYSKKKKN